MVYWYIEKTEIFTIFYDFCNFSESYMREVVLRFKTFENYKEINVKFLKNYENKSIENVCFKSWNQKQSFAGVFQNRCYSKFCKYHRKAPVLESIFNEFVGPGRNICKIFKNTFFYRTPPAAVSREFFPVKVISAAQLLAWAHRIRFWFVFSSYLRGRLQKYDAFDVYKHQTKFWEFSHEEILTYNFYNFMCIISLHIIFSTVYKFHDQVYIWKI